MNFLHNTSIGQTREPSASQSRYPIVHWCIKKGVIMVLHFSTIFFKAKKAPYLSFFHSKNNGSPLKQHFPQPTDHELVFRRWCIFTQIAVRRQKTSAIFLLYTYTYILLSWLYGNPKNRSRENSPPQLQNNRQRRPKKPSFFCHTFLKWLFTHDWHSLKLC